MNNDIELRMPEDFGPMCRRTGEEVMDDDMHRIWAECGKERINNLLWMSLPASTTLRQADDIATDMFNAITRVWDKHIAKLKGSR